jgi:hypothetical protein
VLNPMLSEWELAGLYFEGTIYIYSVIPIAGTRSKWLVREA